MRLASLFALALTAALAGAASAAPVDLRILETTDLHTNALGWDYYQDKPTDEYGLALTAARIKEARAEQANTLLFDNGDLLQGTPLGDFVARVSPLKAGEVHPMHRAMRGLGFDAATLGNHEFNFGLDYLQNVLKSSPFPYVNANVYLADGDADPANDKNAFTPYLIQTKLVKDQGGKVVPLKVGVLGLVTPQIVQWDKSYLEGKVTTRDIVETARKFVPEMKAKGADLIVVLSHSGINRAPAEKGAENASADLTKIEGVDVVLTGHSHADFPSAAYKDVPGVDLEKGTINGKAVLMPGSWGNNLGVADLKLDRVDGRWKVVDARTSLRPVWDKTTKKPLVKPDPAVLNAVKIVHERTLAYVRGKVADLAAPINSFFALVQDDPSVQLVSNAQIAYVKAALKGTPHENLPVLSAAAPFKAGGRAGPAYYTDIPAGTLAIKNVADLYVYPNTVQAVVVTGAGVKEWLERSAGQFNQIDPQKGGAQALVNEAFPTYNFDVIDGVTYEIDVTRPSRYDASGKLVNPQAERVRNLMFGGKPIDPNARFVVATNNYRASGGGSFPGLDGKNIVLQAPDENRQALVTYFTAQGKVNPAADGNWKLAPVPGATVVFTSSPEAQKVLPKNAKLLRVREDGFAEYQLSW